MITPEFIHLRVHTAFSLLEGAIKVEKLAHVCAEQQIPAVAMTDSGNIFGAMALTKACKGEGVQPIIGCQLLIKSPEQDKNAYQLKEPTYDKVVVLVQNEKGYQNLLSMFTPYYMGADKQQTPHLTFDELCFKTDGLILLTGGAEGILGRPVLAGQDEFAENLLEQLKVAFPNRIYMEIQRHGLEIEQNTEPKFLDMAYKMNVPLVATNEAYFLTPDMYEAHDALICIAEKTYVTVEERRKLTPEHYLKTPAEMKELFADLPEAIDNTVLIAKRCAFMTAHKKPAFPNFDCGGLSEDELLEKNANEGLAKRLQGRSEEEKKAYFDRLNYELGIIKQMGFPGYFLIVADFINWSKEHGVPVGPGRGSGAGSVVAWAIRVTDIDPLRFNLLFERFLNPERVSMPDFDVDFCQENRGRTIEYVQNKYGFDHVAQIITFGKLQAKAVIRDVGRVLQIPYPVVDRLSKLVPNTIGITLKEAMEQEPEFENQARSEESIRTLLEIALKLEGLYRNSSTHAAGVVIGNKPLDEIVPIYKDPSSDMPVTQYNMKFVEDASLIKFDFLGLKTLTTIAKTVEHIKKRGIELDVHNLPLDDELTFKLLCDANTSGVFQLESAGMRQVLKDMQPDKIEDIIALVSLYRPGPMDSIPSYIARKKGLEQPDYLHPMLEGILKETYGIMIYQEQVMQISQTMAGYTLGGADLLRRAMGKKIKEEMAKQRDIFINGAVAKGVEKKMAENVFDKMAKFAEYGFNKSHAAAYAYIAYQTAYLKAHYPVEFMAATMTLDKINTDKLAFFKNDLMQMKIDVLPPDINKSGVDFEVEDGKVRYALSAVKNVGEGGMQILVKEREKNGPFKSLQDFFKRMDASALNKRYLENLAKAGAFECIEKNRAKVFGNVEKMIAYANGETTARNSSQMGLFGGSVEATPFKIDDIQEWSHLDKLMMESEALGFYLSAHPLDAFSSVFERLRVNCSADLENIVNVNGTSRVQVAAIVSNVKVRYSQKGNKFGIIYATDKGGAFEVLCFADALAAHQEKLNSGQPLLLNITVDKRADDDRLRISLNDVSYLNDVMSKTASTVIITLEKPDCVDMLKNIISAQNSGQSRVFFIAKTGDYTVDISIPGRYMIAPEAMEKIEHLNGVTEVRHV